MRADGLQMIPGDCVNAFAQLAGFADTTDDVAPSGFPRRGTVFQKKFDMPRVAGSRAFRPFDFDGNDFARRLDNKIDFRAADGTPESDAVPGSQKPRAVDQFKAHPLLQERTALQL